MVSIVGSSLYHEARAAGVIYQATLRRELHHQDLRRSLLQPPRQLRPQHTPDSATSTTETVSATA
jgi:hypothetical protein